MHYVRLGVNGSWPGAGVLDAVIPFASRTPLVWSGPAGHGVMQLVSTCSVGLVMNCTRVSVEQAP